MTSSVPIPLLSLRPLELVLHAGTLRASEQDEAASLPPSITAPSSTNRSYAPWLQVLVGHLVLFNSFGITQSFGVFAPYYARLLDASPSQVSWIGSTHLFLVYFVSAFSGRLLDVGYYRASLGAGIVLQLLGLFLAGNFSTYWVALVTHSVLMGLGDGLMVCPAVTNTALYFENRKKMVPMAVVASGAATGGIVVSLIAKFTIEMLGIAGTMRVVGGVALGNSVVICGLARGMKREGKVARKAWVDWMVFADVQYGLYVLAMFFVFAGLWVPYFYLRDFATTTVHMQKDTCLTILLALNAAGIPGRIIPALLADYFLGTLNTYIFILLFTSATLLLWPLITKPVSIIIWAICYGFCAGGVSSLLQAGIASLNTVPGELGAQIGLAFGVVAFASLIGGPLGGKLIEIGRASGEGNEFLWLQMFAGGVMAVGCGLLACARGWKIRRKV
ncbi:major facilitator superfamily domain-containing protein [Massariosphaeria phaeospora]|uniref:Major facilitator superfamily domain-containing protein n=1 Tax=Massariosphaeria phaeospora TaxID=100035 RepID=A0A7C8HY94_9PLEO|nr:major facilitator superfamily domain-containing protein [Massariosphaeria phaeospora]